MRPKAGAFSRYRPRILTLIVLIVVAAPTVLANLSSEIVPANESPPKGYMYKGTYGWPLIWHWHNLFFSPGPGGIVSWDYSASRLAGNLAMWLAMLAAVGGACEWLLRRHRPPLRWSLRTMLAAVGLLAVCCAWCAAVRNRANLQDSIIAAVKEEGGDVLVERRGPKWLDFVVADRFRRRIIGVEMQMTAGHTLAEEFVVELRGLPRLQYLEINVEQLTPRMAAALADMRQLRSLGIQQETRLKFHDEPIPHECLADIGKLNQLEVLHLGNMKISGEDLECLAGLTNLKSLSWEGAVIAGESLGNLVALTNLKSLRLCRIYCDDDEPGAEEPETNHAPPLLAHLPALPRLEAIDLSNSEVGDRDLRHLAGLHCLKSLDLSYTDVTDEGLAELASLQSLEDLEIDDNMVSAAGIESLLALRHLKALHMYRSYDKSARLAPLALDDGDELFVLESEVEGFRRALQMLRQSNPGIVIDTRSGEAHRYFELMPPYDYDASPDRHPIWLPAQYPWLPPSFLRRFGLQGPGPAGQSAQEESEAGDE